MNEKIEENKRKEGNSNRSSRLEEDIKKIEGKGKGNRKEMEKIKRKRGGKDKFIMS